MKATKRFLTMLILTASAAWGEGLDDILAKAKEGDVAAQIQAAEILASGNGAAKNMKEAAGWYQKAAEQGNPDAQMALGKLNLGGKGLPKNSTEAAKWFGLAAQQGRADAQIQMARMHLAGAGVVKDFVEARKWASLASAQGEKQAQGILSFLSPKMTAQETAKADELIRAFTDKKAADDGAKGIPPAAPPLE